MAELTHGILREQLTAERAHVQGQLSQLGHGTERAPYDDNFADSGLVNAERGEVDAVVGTLLEVLDDIDAALAKIEAGSYGRCEECEKQIAEARLEAMPTARLCIECASSRR